MIRMVNVLLEKYHDQDKLFISWDAASWHNSKKLLSHIEAINSNAGLGTLAMPRVQLAPLPASAQFLNVIESVFSGLAKSVIHNSDYESLEACKAAIDHYFEKRNQYYLENPKRAGHKIWGKERVKPVFDKANICKPPGKRNC
jgi:hypothetical protein